MRASLFLAAGVLCASAAALSAPAAAQTLEAVKQRGELVCGVNGSLRGFSAQDKDGKWTGFDVDFCRAVAAAIFADATKVKFVPLSTSDRFDALKSGQIDLLARNSTWTLSRELDYGLTFTAVTYYDGQGFMVPRSRNADSALELNGSKVCVQKDTTNARNQENYFTQNSMTFEQVLTDSAADSLEKYKSGACDVLTSDVSQLYAERTKLTEPGDNLILPEVISKEPLAPVVRANDPAWALLVQWVHFAMLDAEELGIAKGTVDQAKMSERPAVRRFTGAEGGIGQKLGLQIDWALDVVGLVGNYREVFDRNLGEDSELQIPRGLNQLWSLGGIQYAPSLD